MGLAPARVNAWNPGERSSHCLSVELENPAGHSDDDGPRAAHLGLETNFRRSGEIAPWSSPTGSMPKPKHLMEEAAAAPGL